MTTTRNKGFSPSCFSPSSPSWQERPPRPEGEGDGEREAWQHRLSDQDMLGQPFGFVVVVAGDLIIDGFPPRLW